MTYAQIMKNVPADEQERRMGVITKINILGEKKAACETEADRKHFDKKIRTIARQETSWLKEAAWFLY